MEDCSIEVRGEVQQIFKVLSKDEQDKMPFEGIEIAKTLARIPFFRYYLQPHAEHFVNLCITQIALTYPEKTDVYKLESMQNERSLYIILEGTVRIQSEECSTKRLGVLRVFGHTQIVFGLKERRERAICQTECKLMCITESSLLKIFAERDSLLKKLHFLNINHYFDELSQLEKMQLALALTKRGFQRGEVLKGENQGLDTVFYFIYGRADVSTKLSIDKKERQYIIDSLEEMSSFGEYQCVSESGTTFKLKGTIAGAFYVLNFSQIKKEEHRICDLIKGRAIPYPNNNELVFLQGVKSTLRKQQNRVMKGLGLRR